MPIPGSSPSRWRGTVSSWARHSAVAGATPAPPNALRPTRNGNRGVLSVMAAQRDMGLRTSARILQDRRLNLIHIPLRLYGHFVQAILALVLPDPQHKHGVRKQDQEGYYPDRGQSQATDIINISVTEVECSIVCSKKRVERFFKPLLDVLSKEDRATVAISEDEFVAIQVDGEGLEAGQRVLDLTSPLAMAGVSIFFISTYFSDYILVPSKSTSAVITALQQRGFVLEKYSDTYSHRRSSSAASFQSTTTSTSTSYGAPALTAKSITDLESATFSTLRASNITPQFNPAQRLILVAERRNTRQSATTPSFTLGLIRCLNTQPGFLSITLTDAEAASILLEIEQLGYFDIEQDLLHGNRKNQLIPITLDLRGLPVESTGIVCGVAGRLVGATGKTGERSVEMVYLSTARAGTVMVAECDVDRAMAALTL